MDERNDFEAQVEQEEKAQAEPEVEVEFEYQEPAGEETARANSELVEKIKELVKKGNVTKIVIKKGDNVLVNIPLNVGIVGGIIGVAAAPWAIVAAAVATAGFACKVELVKDDGEIVKVSGDAISQKAKDLGEKAKDVGAAVVDGIKDAVKAEDPDVEVVIEEEPAEAPAEEAPTIEIPVEDASGET